MHFDPVLLPPRRSASLASGLWHDITINDALDGCVAACPDKVALTALRVETGETKCFTYRELASTVDRVAIGLSRLGVERGDVVAMQLPNWWQFSVLYLACCRLGAALNPLMHIFRERELSFMLGHAQAKVLVVPKQFRQFDHEAMARSLQRDLPSLKQIVVVGGQGADSFEALLMDQAWERGADARTFLQQDRLAPDDVTQLIYTSGTTGEPKGVMHSSNTLISNIMPYAERLHLTREDVILMASPMAHQTGFMYGLMMPILLRASAVLQDIWNPVVAADLIRAERVSFTMASTPFLTDLTRTVQESAKAVPTLKVFLCAGAPIPGTLVEAARNVLGTKIISAWGMSENGAVTTTLPEDDDRLSSSTDGCPLPGVEVKIVGSDGDALAPGASGRLLVRSCSNFGGYLKRPEWNATDADGWFDTGDLAMTNEAGYIRISGRSKDVIIRGGENIPVFEVESLLYKHPSVAHAAIVAYADERLGERACAVVVPKEGMSLQFDEMVAFLKAQKVALQYIPERLIIRPEVPTTPTGKIQKFKLRELLRNGEL